MKKYDNKIITELQKVCTAEEIVLVLVDEADEELRRKVQTVTSVLLDEFTFDGYDDGSKNIESLKGLFS